MNFTGKPFTILGTKLLDYSHGTNQAVSRNTKQSKAQYEGITRFTF